MVQAPVGIGMAGHGRLDMGQKNECPVCGRVMERCQNPLQGTFFLCSVHGVQIPSGEIQQRDIVPRDQTE